MPTATLTLKKINLFFFFKEGEKALPQAAWLLRVYISPQTHASDNMAAINQGWQEVRKFQCTCLK